MAPTTKPEEHSRQKRKESSRYSLRAVGVPVTPVEPRTRDPDLPLKEANKRRISGPGPHGANVKNRKLAAKDDKSPTEDRVAEEGRSQAPSEVSGEGERVEDGLSVNQHFVLGFEKAEEVPQQEALGQQGAGAQEEPISWDLLDPLGLFDNANQAQEFYY